MPLPPLPIFHSFGLSSLYTVSILCANRPMVAIPDDGEHGGGVQGDAAGAEQPSGAQD